jgi:glycosyltransferase involved in cell wall biosynthesis
MLALARAKIPFVSISQLNTPYSWPGESTFESVGEAFARAKACVFVSQGNLELFQNQIARQLDNAIVIYNPPSFDVTTPCSIPDSEGFRLLNVARISPGHKGQDLLIDVLSMTKWKSRKITLEIAGKGDTRWIEALLRSKRVDSVRLLGHVTDLRRVWELATFGIFPSRQEGMPLALVEGMALGRPVIATDVAGHREWIEHGVNGFLASGTTSTSLDQAMENAWEKRHLVADMGRNARRTFESRLAVDPVQRLAEAIALQ